MNQIQCSKCLGEGIIGNGDNPHLKQGALHTCDACHGTGKVDAEVASQGAVAPAEEAKVEDTASDTAETTQSTDGEEKKSEEQSDTTDSQESVSDQVEKTEETESTSTE